MGAASRPRLCKRGETPLVPRLLLSLPPPPLASRKAAGLLLCGPLRAASRRPLRKSSVAPSAPSAQRRSSRAAGTAAVRAGLGWGRPLRGAAPLGRAEGAAAPCSALPAPGGAAAQPRRGLRAGLVKQSGPRTVPLGLEVSGEETPSPQPAALPLPVSLTGGAERTRQR